MKRFQQTYQVDHERRARALRNLKLAHDAREPAANDLPEESDAELCVEAIFFETPNRAGGSDPGSSDPTSDG